MNSDLTVVKRLSARIQALLLLVALNGYFILHALVLSVAVLQMLVDL